MRPLEDRLVWLYFVVPCALLGAGYAFSVDRGVGPAVGGLAMGAMAGVILAVIVNLGVLVTRRRATSRKRDEVDSPAEEKSR